MTPKDQERIITLEGIQTLNTAMAALVLKRQSTLNFFSRMKKEGYVTRSGGAKQPRFYTVTRTKQRPRDDGMFDILNKYNPHFKLNPWYDHQVHGKYGPEEALVDAIETGSFRVILASTRLFNHITDWKKLYHTSNSRGIWNKVGALYDVARKFMRVKKMPKKYHPSLASSWKQLTQLKKKNFLDVANKWHIYISMNEKDMEAVL